MRLAHFLCCLLIGACSLMPDSDRATVDGESSEPTVFAALTDSEIEHVLNGHYVEFDQGQEHVGRYRIRRESYCDGLMTTAGDRVARITSPYRIENGQVCIESGGSTSCRALYRDGGGVLHMRWLREDGSLLVTHRVALGASPTGECVN